MPNQAYPTNNQAVPQPQNYPTQEQDPRAVFAQLAQGKPRKKNIFANKTILIIGALILIILVLVGTLVAVMGKPEQPQTPETTTLTFWGTSVEENVMAELISEFERDNPYIKIKYERQPETDYKNRVETRLQIKNVVALPDIVEVENVWLVELAKYVQSVNDPTILNRFANQAIKNNTINNYIYGVPFRFDALTLAYNEKHLSEISLTEENFNQLDWSSLVTRAQNLTKTKKAKVGTSDVEIDVITRAGMAMGSPKNVTNAEKILELLLLQNEVEIYKESTKKFDLDTKFNTVIDFYTQFAMRGSWDDTVGNDIEAFTQEKVSMILLRSRDIDTVLAKNPNFKFKTVLPAKIGSIKNLSLGTSLAFPRVKTTQPQALKFVEYLTREENATKLFNAKNRNTFVPATQNSLNAIPKGSPFAVYSDIAPTAEVFLTPDYEATAKVLTTFLSESFTQNFGRLQPGQKPSRFIVDVSGLENDLNRAVVPTATPTATPVKN